MEIASVILKQNFDKAMLDQIDTLRTIRLNLAEKMLRELSHTAAELTPNETVRRMPLTRERIRSSTKRTIIASVNGIAPNTAIMNPSCNANSVQPVALDAAMKSGACSATTAR